MTSIQENSPPPRLGFYERFIQWRYTRKNTCTVQITIPRMKIKGRVVRVSGKTHYVAFRGIPYALPPIGRRRFQPPQPLPQETEDIEAYEDPEPCFQYDNRTMKYKGSEDCLYLNIYIPKKPKKIAELLPVLVYIHGGGFTAGHGNTDDITPDNIMKEGMIFVTVNYRLGLLGFLNMRTENCLGNAGLKDQVMALRWIRDNIEQFKGDPQNVTISGQSAGGSAVNFHLISPLSRGLFHKAIVMAGGVYCPWGFGGHGREVKELLKTTTQMNYLARHVVVEIFKGASLEYLINLQMELTKHKLKMEPYRMGVFLRPSVECLPNSDAFLPDTVENLMEEAEPVPTIAGITKQEGYHYMRELTREDIANIVTQPKKFFNFLKSNFRWTRASVRKQMQTLRKRYFPPVKRLFWEDIEQGFATMVTDIFFRRFYDNFKIGNLMKSGWPPFYVYEFDYFSGKPIYGEDSVMPIASEHGDEMTILLAPHILKEDFFPRFTRNEQLKVREEIKRVTNHLSHLFCSFCKVGTPTSLEETGDIFEWRAHTEEDPCYVIIKETLAMRNGQLNEKRWRQLNAICESASEVPSLAETPQTPSEHNLIDWELGL